MTNTYNPRGRWAPRTPHRRHFPCLHRGEASASGGSTVISAWPTGTSGPVAAQEVEYQLLERGAGGRDHRVRHSVGGHHYF